MASTRSTTRSQADSSRNALVALARMQVAGLTAAAKAFAGWAQAADRFAQVVGDELLRRVDGQSDSAELASRIARAADAHLRELGALPRAAIDHFDARLARVSTTTGRNS